MLYLTLGIIIIISYLLSCCVREITNSEQNILYETSGAIAKVTAKGLHASSLHYLRLVARTHGEYFKKTTTSPKKLLVCVETHHAY